MKWVYPEPASLPRMVANDTLRKIGVCEDAEEMHKHLRDLLDWFLPMGEEPDWDQHPHATAIWKLWSRGSN